MVAMKIILPFLCALALASGSRVELYKRRSVKEIEFAPDGRIVNGGEAQPGQFPYQALVLSYFDGDEEALCGGSLLSTKYVLTAAHCVMSLYVEGAFATHGTVILGVHNRQLEEPSQQSIDFASINAHNWNIAEMQNDIATIELATPAVFNDYVQPIELPAMSDQRTFSGMLATVSGFGRTNDIPGSPESDMVRYTRNPVLTNANCRAMLEPFSVQPQHLCLSGIGGRSPCHGDSGGPLTIQEDGRSVQIGVVAFVLGGICSVGVPVGFMRVSYFLNWIALNSDVVLRP
ncbi:collagenase-like [Culex pipiens pallens]|uniref:collagenase-like n=1 Tax=Culex pipiens pallens TaxID=42434 RepID=UPI00195467B8|nr:collagenase-like [Culex pipiens pallens]